MAITESLRDGIRLFELIALSSQPQTIAMLVRACERPLPEGADETTPVMTDSSIRNTVETLVGCGWLVEYPGKGNAKSYGLGERAAKLWPIYLGRKLDLIAERQAQTAAEIEQTRRLLDAGAA